MASLDNCPELGSEGHGRCSFLNKKKIIMSQGTALFEDGKGGGDSAALWLVTCGGFDGAAAGSR